MYSPNSQPGPADMSTIDLHIVGLPFPHLLYQRREADINRPLVWSFTLRHPTFHFPFGDHDQFVLGELGVLDY